MAKMSKSVLDRRKRFYDSIVQDERNRSRDVSIGQMLLCFSDISRISDEDWTAETIRRMKQKWKDRLFMASSDEEYEEIVEKEEVYIHHMPSSNVGESKGTTEKMVEETNHLSCNDLEGSKDTTEKMEEETCTNHMPNIDKDGGSEEIVEKNVENATHMSSSAVEVAKDTTGKVVGKVDKWISLAQILSLSEDEDLTTTKQIETEEKKKKGVYDVSSSEDEDYLRKERSKRKEKKRKYLNGVSSSEDEEYLRKERRKKRKEKKRKRFDGGSSLSENENPLHPEKEQEAKFFAANDFFDQDSKTEPKDPKHSRKPYTHEERTTILQYILANDLCANVKGREMWVVMERKKICPNRTWQSLKEHYLKKISKNLKLYDFLTKSDREKIKMYC